MSGPVPSPSMKGMMGRSGTSRRPSEPARMASPGGTVEREYRGIRLLKQEKRAPRKADPPRAARRALDVPQRSTFPGAAVPFMLVALSPDHHDRLTARLARHA